MKTKRLISVLLCLTLVLSFGGCGAPSGSEPAAGGTATSDEPSAESPKMTESASATDAPDDVAQAAVADSAGSTPAESENTGDFQLPICQCLGTSTLIGSTNTKDGIRNPLGAPNLVFLRCFFQYSRLFLIL